MTELTLTLVGALLIATLAATPVAALALADCTRTTHPSHGGEAQHRDLGEGRVFWIEWWSQEGVYEDVLIADCRAGEVLRARTREERIGRRPAFDRTDKALAKIDTLMAGSAAFFTLQRVADSLKGIARDIETAALTQDPCGCAAAYPDATGAREPFEMDK